MSPMTPCQLCPACHLSTDGCTDLTLSPLRTPLVFMLMITSEQTGYDPDNT